MKKSWKDSIPAGHPAAKREGFVQLVNLLYKLNVTYYLAIPAVSNPYHLFDTRELPVSLIAAMRMVKR